MAADRDINQHLTAVMVVIDVYPQMMREMIVNVWPPNNVLMLIQNDQHQILMNNITSQQKKMVKKLNTDGYNALDLSCLYKVIRHCKLLPPPKQGWGNIPNSEDQSEGDDVERMKRHRNDILHRPRGGLSVAERDYFFQQSIEIATRMDNKNGSPQNGFECRIEKIKTEIVRTVSKKKYMEALENLAECKEKLHEKDRPCIILCYGDNITKKIGTQYDQEDLKKKEVTVALIKPDVVEEGKVDQIIEDIREAGIEILRHEERQLTEDDVRDRFYSHLQNQQYFHDLVRFMTGGPSHVLVLTKCNNGENIIENFRDLIGPTDVEEAKTYKPESLRAKYGQRSFMNAIHGSSSLDMAKRELALFFPDFVAPAVEGNAVKLQTTLALVRPEAVRIYKDTIIAKICESGFQVAMQKEINFTREMVNEFYKEYQGQEHFDQLIQNMTSGPVLALGLIRENAIREWRDILGPQKFNRAKEEAPYSLQEQFAVDDEINSLHGSDSEESAKKELQLFFPIEETVAVIKPDAMKNKKEIVNRIHAACFRIAATKTTSLSDEVAKKFYSNCEYKDYYNDLIDHMKSGETYFMGLCREGAVEGWRSMIGPSDPTEAKMVSPDSIRATYGESILRNAVHGSSNPEHAKRSIKTIFGDRSCSCTIVLRDLDIDNEAVLSIKNVLLENICTEDIKLIDIEHGSLILHVTIPNWCFMTMNILHKRIYTFLHQFFVVASIPCTDGHIFTVVLAESDDFIIDNNLEKSDDIDYLKEKTLPVLKLSVSIKDSAFQDEFVLYREFNRFFSGMYNVIDRHNVPVNGSAREVLMLTPNENDENVASNSEDIQDSQLRLAQPNVSEEETNFFKISTLLLGIAPRAVKIKFDDVFPPEHLRDTLSLNIERLTELKNNRSINPVQWNSMFPSTSYPTSEFFDTTLMICLFSNLRGIQISHQFPPPKDLSFEADLSRIKLYRKEIANSKDRVFTNAKFTAHWNEAEAAVIRLSGEKLKGECGKLKIKLYDIADRQKIVHKVQAVRKLAQIENLNEDLDTFEKLNLKQQEKEDNELLLLPPKNEVMLQTLKLGTFVGKLAKEEFKSWLIDIEFVENEYLLVTDARNKKLKKFCFKGQLQNEVSFANRPMFFTCFDDRMAYVTFPDENIIRVVNSNNQLEVVTELTVNKGCCGIAKIDQHKFALACRSKCKIYIMSRTGKKLQTIKPIIGKDEISITNIPSTGTDEANDSEEEGANRGHPQTAGQKDFDALKRHRQALKKSDIQCRLVWAGFIDASEKQIFVTDYETKHLTIVYIENETSFRHKSIPLVDPRGVVIHENKLFVSAGTIRLLTLDGEAITEVPLHGGPITFPRSIAFDKTGHYMAVTHKGDGDDCFSVFQLLSS